MAKTITAYTGGSYIAKVSTTQSKFGGASAFFTNPPDSSNHSYLIVNDDAELEPGSGDFTIDFWFYPTDGTNRQALLHWSNSSDWSLGMDFHWNGTRNVNIWASSNGTSWDLINADGGGNGIGTTSLSLNAWHHIAFVRNGNNWRTYIDGTVNLDLTVSGTVINKANDKVIGDWFNRTAMSNPKDAYMDEFRYSNTARWTSNFTPETSAYATDVNTKLLIHCDGANGSTTFTDDSVTAFIPQIMII